MYTILDNVLNTDSNPDLFFLLYLPGCVSVRITDHLSPRQLVCVLCAVTEKVTITNPLRWLLWNEA